MAVPLAFSIWSDPFYTLFNTIPLYVWQIPLLLLLIGLIIFWRIYRSKQM